VGNHPVGDNNLPPTPTPNCINYDLKKIILLKKIHVSNFYILRMKKIHVSTPATQFWIFPVSISEPSKIDFFQLNLR
jgi:hypothetical protein